MKILNLGCGTKTSNMPGVVNIDWGTYLRLKKMRVLRPFVPLFLRGERLEKFKSLANNIMVHDLSTGIPFKSDSIDVVYHSHILEHLDKDVAENFLREVKRVLKPGGIHRIVVPDLEKACKSYISHIATCESNESESENHDSYIAELLEQSVRRESWGTSQQSSLRKFFENLILGDARRRGETHQWMYDRINLSTKLINIGYKEVKVKDYDSSLISNWNEFGLDLDEFGNQYKTESLYIEARK